MISIAWWQLLLALVIGEAGYSFFRGFVRSAWRQLFPYCNVIECRLRVEHKHGVDAEGAFVEIPLTTATLKDVRLRPPPKVKWDSGTLRNGENVKYDG